MSPHFGPRRAWRQVEAEHCELLQLYNSDTIQRDIIDKHDHTTMFNDTWDCAPGRFKRLRSFCDRLTTVLANTTFVESNFLILKWELDKVARCSCTCRLKEPSKPSSTSSCKRFCVEHNEIKYNTMCCVKTKLVLLKFRFLKTYEACLCEHFIFQNIHRCSLVERTFH